jgi:hypothetical protein
LASDSGSAEVFHALILTEMIGISGVGKRDFGNNYGNFALDRCGVGRQAKTAIALHS